MKTVYEMFPDIDAQRNPRNYVDIKDPFFWKTVDKCKAYSLLSVEGFYNLYRSIEYVARHKIPGDIVECGVFLGGAILAMSEFAAHFGMTDRTFHLYDTFEGFPDKSEDVDLHGSKITFSKHNNFLNTVRKTISSSRYPADKFQFIPGPVEETLPRQKPAQIAVLRLDTDYYESTRVEFVELYPRLAVGGVLIVDDYGYFQGARRATDEYLAQNNAKIMLCRINFTVRSGVKLA